MHHDLKQVDQPKPSEQELKQAEETRKAKLRLESICKLLGAAGDGLGQKKQQEALANKFEEIVLAQGNKYDAQSLRLLMDMQWQSMNTQTSKLQDELNQVREQLEYQKKKAY